MKVTDAMVQKFAACIEEAEIESPWQDTLPVLRRVLEVVLESVDVSDPAVVNAMSEVVSELSDRIAVLDGKLAMVREAHESYWRTDGTGIDREEYDEIITGVVECP